jgi:C-terminal processing protease CtpA/Prc
VSVELTPAAEGEEPRVELAGIGVVLQIAGDGLRVARVAPGGGAAEVGIAAGDEILFVDGRPVAEVGFKGAIDMIRGPEGSTVILGMRRAGEGPVVPVPVPRRLVRG